LLKLFADVFNLHLQFSVMIKKKNSNVYKKNNVTEYLIVDDGDGMGIEKLENALDLGSSDYYYAENTLSKFGLGLKSASFAQGKRLEVISGNGVEIHKESVDLDDIEEEYFSVEDPLSSEDELLVNKYFVGGKRGTIIRISKIYTNNHPSVKSTISDLREKIGVIYYYFLIGNVVRIYVDNEELQPFDPLFVDEAGENNLDENEWDGKSVQWLMRPETLMLDAEAKIKGQVEITMLPHPQVRKDEGITDAEIRNKYHINANNYGFYVYRNGRLINWADKLGVIPFDQDFYAFRGRINIHDDADDAFNIDASKSHISLSEEAKNSLDDFISDYRRKCKTAWKKAYDKYKAKMSENSNDISNDLSMDSEDYLVILENDDAPGFNEEYDRRNDAIVEENREKEKKRKESNCFEN
ncbi:MAG: ATP-binding protein, partial [Lachnospiraceae bacterium]|nr:ATP-binding protein [Lachnospiraceae bacterium]